MAVAAIRSDTGAFCPLAVVADAVIRIEKTIIPTVNIFASLDNRKHFR
jgi:hypothetical protein